MKKQLLYRPVGMLVGVAAGAVSAMLVKQVWRLVPGPEGTPDALDEERGWGEVLAAAALQGVVFALVRAALDRATAQGVRRLTGEWPG